jgi:hypothetical protein
MFCGPLFSPLSTSNLTGGYCVALLAVGSVPFVFNLATVLGLVRVAMNRHQISDFRFAQFQGDNSLGPEMKPPLL